MNRRLGLPTNDKVRDLGEEDGNNRAILTLAKYRCVWSAGGGKYWETRLMCGGVYEDELKDEADTVIAQKPITSAPEGLSKPEEDDGYYYPGSDPQE